MIALLLIATSARAQPEGEAGAGLRPDPPSSVDILVGTAAILQSVDIFTTAYTLQLGGAREANPFLAPFEGRPVVLASVSGAIRKSRWAGL